MHALDAQLDQLSDGGDITQVAWEKPTLAYADVLTRGNYAARDGARRGEHTTLSCRRFLPVNRTIGWRLRDGQ